MYFWTAKNKKLCLFLFVRLLFSLGENGKLSVHRGEWCNMVRTAHIVLSLSVLSLGRCRGWLFGTNHLLQTPACKHLSSLYTLLLLLLYHISCCIVLLSLSVTFYSIYGDSDADQGNVCVPHILIYNHTLHITLHITHHTSHITYKRTFLLCFSSTRKHRNIVSIAVLYTIMKSVATVHICCCFFHWFNY